MSSQEDGRSKSPVPILSPQRHLEFSTEVLRGLVEDWTGPGGTTPFQTNLGSSHIGDVTHLVSDAGVGGDLPPWSGPPGRSRHIVAPSVQEESRGEGDKEQPLRGSEEAGQACTPPRPFRPAPCLPRPPSRAPPRPLLLAPAPSPPTPGLTVPPTKVCPAHTGSATPTPGLPLSQRSCPPPPARSKLAFPRKVACVLRRWTAACSSR